MLQWLLTFMWLFFVDLCVWLTLKISLMCFFYIHFTLNTAHNIYIDRQTNNFIKFKTALIMQMSYRALGMASALFNNTVFCVFNAFWNALITHNFLHCWCILKCIIRNILRYSRILEISKKCNFALFEDRFWRGFLQK